MAITSYPRFLTLHTESGEASLTEDEIIRIYGKRWSIEVFFKVCKSYLCLTKECRSISFDAMTAHTAVLHIFFCLHYPYFSLAFLDYPASTIRQYPRHRSSPLQSSHF